MFLPSGSPDPIDTIMMKTPNFEDHHVSCSKKLNDFTVDSVIINKKLTHENSTFELFSLIFNLIKLLNQITSIYKPLV